MKVDKVTKRAIRKMHFKPMALEYIIWVDSQGSPGWRGKDEAIINSPMYCRTAGFVVQENADKIEVVQSEGAMQVGNSILIPKCAILGRHKILNADEALEFVELAIK